MNRADRRAAASRRQAGGTPRELAFLAQCADFLREIKPGHKPTQSDYAIYAYVKANTAQRRLRADPETRRLARQAAGRYAW